MSTHDASNYRNDRQIDRQTGRKNSGDEYRKPKARIKNKNSDWPKACYSTQYSPMLIRESPPPPPTRPCGSASSPTTTPPPP